MMNYLILINLMSTELTVNITGILRSGGVIAVVKNDLYSSIIKVTSFTGVDTFFVDKNLISIFLYL